MRELLSLFFIVSYVIACPNFCSQHGTCGANDACTCYPGFTGGDCSLRTCPFDVSFASGVLGDYEQLYSECSSQGLCDRETGLCNCFDGYEGAACQRTICPNSCSGHGICTSIKYIDVTHSDKFYVNYYENPKNDTDRQFVCLCDSLYTGSDCSLRKCPMGYYPSSDCETDAKAPQVIKLKNIVNGDETKNNLAYVKYRDVFGKVWYTTAFNVLDGDEWKRQIGHLAPNIVDLEKVDVSEDKTDDKSGTYREISITYGPTTTGRQHRMEIITNKVLEEDEFYVNHIFPGGYHGMVKIEDNALEADIEYVDLYKRPPTECSNNGECDNTSGLCSCFTGYYGPACEEASSIM